jgi:hypothetical protein
MPGMRPRAAAPSRHSEREIDGAVEEATRDSERT